MASSLTSLVNDDSRYQKSFQLFLERSSEHQCMQDFIHNMLPDILASIGNGKSHLNVIGVGSGAGEIDLEMLSELRQKHPGVTVDNEVVEPSSQQLHNYRVSVSQKKDLDYITFSWNRMTASEFEEHWKEKKMTKKADFIHMIQMLYYVKDPGATISFFQSLLDKNGKLLIILVSGESGWGKLWRTYRHQLCNPDISQCVTTEDIKNFLDSKGVRYQNYELPSQMDITECFTEGDEKGELLLDFLTEAKFMSYATKAHWKEASQAVGGDGNSTALKSGSTTESLSSVFSLHILKGSAMAVQPNQTCYEGSSVQSFQFYLEHSGEHKAMLQFVQNTLPGEFTRIGAGKSSLDVLGVGSGGGEMDVHILSLLQSTFPAVPITADIVEGSSKLSDNFKALVAKTANLQKIPFGWHIMHSGDYEKQVKAKGDIKKFDFIHMIQMIYYVDDLSETIKFYHSLLKNNGKLMIIIEAENSGWDLLWKTFKNELCGEAIKEYRSSAEVIACLKKQGLKYDEHPAPNSFDITECFNPSSQTGQRLLNFMTATDHFYKSFTPEIRASMLDLLRNKCSAEKDGKVLFNSDLRCILIHA